MMIGSLGYLSVANGPAKVFVWLQNITATAGLVNWGFICLSWIRFNRARELQGIPRSSLPYRARLMPYAAWYGWMLSWVIAVISGFSVFLSGNWSVSNFFSNYVSLLIYAVLYFGWKIWRKEYKLIPLAEMDLMSGRGAKFQEGITVSIEEEKRLSEESAQAHIHTKWDKFIDWLL